MLFQDHPSSSIFFTDFLAYGIEGMFKSVGATVGHHQHALKSLQLEKPVKHIVYLITFDQTHFPQK